MSAGRFRAPRNDAGGHPGTLQPDRQEHGLGVPRLGSEGVHPDVIGVICVEHEPGGMSAVRHGTPVISLGWWGNGTDSKAVTPVRSAEMVMRRDTTAVLTLSRASLTLLGLTAVILGLLGMHVWMNGHGSTTHHATAVPGTAVPGTANNSTAIPGHPDQHGPETTPPWMNGAAQTQARVVVHASGVAAPAAITAGDSAAVAGCAGECTDEMVMSMCVLAMLAVGLAHVALPRGRVLAWTLTSRGPPLPRRTARPTPPPSLTQLCISRI